MKTQNGQLSKAFVCIADLVRHNPEIVALCREQGLKVHADTGDPEYCDAAPQAMTMPFVRLLSQGGRGKWDTTCRHKIELQVLVEIGLDGPATALDVMNVWEIVLRATSPHTSVKNTTVNAITKGQGIQTVEHTEMASSVEKAATGDAHFRFGTGGLVATLYIHT